MHSQRQDLVHLHAVALDGDPDIHLRVVFLLHRSAEALYLAKNGRERHLSSFNPGACGPNQADHLKTLALDPRDCAVRPFVRVGRWWIWGLQVGVVDVQRKLCVKVFCMDSRPGPSGLPCPDIQKTDLVPDQPPNVDLHRR